MSFVASVLRSQPKIALSVASSRVAVAAAASSSSGESKKAPFWSTAPVNKQEEEKTETEAPKERVTTKDIVKMVAETHDLSQAESKRIVNTIFDTIVDSLSNKKAVSVANFGGFETYKAKGFMGRIPKTGERIMIPPKNRIRFKPYTEFKKSVES